MKRLFKRVLLILFCVSLLLGICAISASAYSSGVTVGTGKTSIGPKDLINYKDSTKIIVADGVTEIQDNTFYYCDMESVTLPDSLRTIGDSAFSGCKNLTEVKIPKKVTHIGSHAFQRCENLKSITIPENLTSIGNYAFELCEKLTTVYFNAINYNSGTGNWFGYQNNVKSLVIGLHVKTIPESAFSYCSNLESLTIPANVKTIEEHAFEYCVNLKTVTLEEGLECIEDWAFYGCKALTEITIPNSVTYIGENAFALCSDDLKINIEDESLLYGAIPHEGYWDELWFGLVTVFGGAAIVLIIILIIALLSSLAMNVIYLIGCIKITKIYCRKKGTSAGGLIALAVIASLLGLGFWYLLVFAILNHNEKQQLV